MHRCFFLSFLLLSLAVFPVMSNGQAKLVVGNKPIEVLPAEQQQLFSERLAIFLRYHQEKNWADLYDMFPKKHTQHPEITKEQFLSDIKKHGKRPMKSFDLQEIIPNESIEGTWAINGCAKMKDGVGSKRWKATIYASMEGSQWVFSDVMFSYQLEASEPMPCLGR